MANPPKRRPGGAGTGGPKKGGKPGGRPAPRPDSPAGSKQPRRQPFAPLADQASEPSAAIDDLDAGDDAPSWFAVRTVVHLEFDDLYEERVTLWHTASFDDAVTEAEAEAEQYAVEHDGEYLGLAQAFEIDGTPGHGVEVFSLIRECPLPPDAYLDQFFDTGLERQREL